MFQDELYSSSFSASDEYSLPTHEKLEKISHCFPTLDDIDSMVYIFYGCCCLTRRMEKYERNLHS